LATLPGGTKQYSAGFNNATLNIEATTVTFMNEYGIDFVSSTLQETNSASSRAAEMQGGLNVVKLDFEDNSAINMDTSSPGYGGIDGSGTNGTKPVDVNFYQATYTCNFGSGTPGSNEFVCRNWTNKASFTQTLNLNGTLPGVKTTWATIIVCTNGGSFPTQFPTINVNSNPFDKNHWSFNTSSGESATYTP
jgi:hypothetical protein